MARNSVGRVLPRHGRSQRFKSARANHKKIKHLGKTHKCFLIFVAALFQFERDCCFLLLMDFSTFVDKKQSLVL